MHESNRAASGFSPKIFVRIVNYADGWIPVAGFGQLEQLEQAINGLREGQEKPTKTLRRFVYLR
jgi:hypothetical protein